MLTQTRIFRSVGLFLFAATLTLLVSLNCSSSSAPTGSGGGGQSNAVLSLNGAASDIQVQANLTEHVHVTYQTPPSVGNIQAVEIDIAASVQHMSYTVSIVEVLASLWSNGIDSSLQVTLRVGNDEATVCTSGYNYGTTTVSAAYLLSPPPANASLDTSTVRILNAGTMVICMQILSTVDVSFSITNVEATITEGDCDPPANFDGGWAGTYQCDGPCGMFGDTIDLAIIQTGTTASYTDGTADYTGTICGNVYRFEGSGPGYTECGTLTIEPSGLAIKRSSYRETTPPFCTGNCLDSLYRVVTTVARESE